MEDKGTTITPIFQFAKNNGLDEKEFFDFVKSKTGADITPEHGETQGFLEKMFDEYADKKFKERPKRDIFTDKDKKYLDYEITNDKDVENFDEDELYDQMESMGDMPSDMQLHKALKKADTNDNGEIEVDEMADFQKSLDDYASKNKKGRDDIPVTTRR